MGATKKFYQLTVRSVVWIAAIFFHSLIGQAEALSPPIETDSLGAVPTNGTKWTSKAIGYRYQQFDKALEDFLRSKNISRKDFFTKSRKTVKGVYLSSRPLPLKEISKEIGLHAGQRVLDLGSGSGVVAILWASLFGVEVTGIEYDKSLWWFSEEFREFAEERGIIQKGQIRFIGPDDPQTGGDFLKHPWQGYDVIYYFAIGSRDFPAIVRKLKKELTKNAVFVYRGYVFGPKNREIKKLRAERFTMEEFPDYAVLLVRQNRWRFRARDFIDGIQARVQGGEFSSRSLQKAL